ncbi:hypothetical protein NDU88_002209 [Pleurodeles waltl]|uniref:Uncharacterized protein n=1 Tax=Pleurodeles waltl TaxID=8319 RepID=A0AAV7WPJ3_PLEWA|nr:hypothetical protein NDU88_002209 [Pleurodeles waltl]
MSGRARLSCIGEEELGAFVWLVPLSSNDAGGGGSVIQGIQIKARRLHWAKVLFHLKRVFNTPWNEHQLKHSWADLVAREQDLLDHLGLVIGDPVGECHIGKCVQ